MLEGGVTLQPQTKMNREDQFLKVHAEHCRGMTQKHTKTTSLSNVSLLYLSSRTPSEQDPAKTSQNWNLEDFGGKLVVRCQVA